MQSKFSQLPVNNGQAVENFREIYTYDDGANLLKKQHIAPSSTWSVETTPEQNSNRLADTRYDASGNPLSLQINDAVQLVFNCCENLVSVPVITRPGEANDADYYVYDSTEQRTRKVSEKYNTPTSVTYEDSIYAGNFLYREKGTQTNDGARTISEQRQTVRIMDGNSCILIVHHWLQHSPGINSSAPPPDQYRYQLDNLLGSVSLELDEMAQLISYEEYFPYGGTSIIAGSNQLEVAEKIYRYTGKECDNTTGLYYYGRRYYVSWLGRWLNADPAGTINGLNLYAFVGGNPTSHIDPTGLALTNPLAINAASPVLGGQHIPFGGAATAAAVHFGMNAFGPGDENTEGFYGYRDDAIIHGTGIMAETSWTHIFGTNNGPLTRAGRVAPWQRGLSLTALVTGIIVGAGIGFRTGHPILGGFLGALAGLVGALATGSIARQRRIQAAAASANVTGSATIGRVTNSFLSGRSDYRHRVLVPADVALYRHAISAFSGDKNVVNLGAADNPDRRRLGIRYSKAAIDFVFANRAAGASIHFHLDGLVIDNGGINIDFSPSNKGSNVQSGGGGPVKDTVTAHELRYLARRFHRDADAGRPTPPVTFYLNGQPRPGVQLPHHTLFGSRR